MLLSQFPSTFHQTQNGMPCFMAQLMTILVLIGMVFLIIREMLHGMISLKWVILLLLARFCEWVQVEIGVYIPHRNHQVKPYSSPWCSERLLIVAKGFLKLLRVHVFPKSRLRDFWRIASTTFSTKVNLLYLLYFTPQRCCLLIKQSFLLKTFQKTLILTTHVFLYLFFLLEFIRSCAILL